MSVLVLHRNPLEPFPYREWLTGLEGDVVLLADRGKILAAGEEPPAGDLGYAHLEVFDDFDAPGVLERALELAVRHRVTSVIAFHEADVARAAWLRERLGLAGAWPRDVLPFRDKLLMKRLAAEHGVEVAPHTVPATAGAARAFADAHGLPLVFKERDGFNAIGLRVVREEAELADCLAALFTGAGPREDVLLEAFVPGRMCHVDGLVVDGRVAAAWPSQYQYDLSSFGADPGPRVDLTLDEDDPLTPRLLELTDRTLAALTGGGSRLRDHAFHAEIFHTPDDRLVLCEIACRPGGAKIREVFEVLFGMHLGAYASRAEAGLPLAGLGGGERPRPRAMAGQVLTMKRPGRVRAVPEAPDEPWVEGFWLYVRPGQVIPRAATSSDFLSAAVASGSSRAEAERRLRALGDRVLAGTVVEAALEGAS
ncbi:hypothetical protein GCM10023347_45280 [Streptomyces chumphonensis]|uniref:ATP-grasp domain-containing protein n=1 Tax=Streptomyces chumphonensis TaxID=1214925 RepID=A0A927ICQ3_9ACTN|nr:hypothetical protein [Streptomyces chumphonensis]MBD3932130.1 hypothetical protein [Streptomyces chumphonensis]